MPFQETSKEKGQKHIGRKPFAFDMCRLVQTIQQKLCFEFFLHSEHSNQKGEVKPTLKTWLQIKIMPEDHSSQLEFVQNSGSGNALRRCLGF